MNYDEYILEAKKFSGDASVTRLISHLVDWKTDDNDLLHLFDSVESFFGNSWISSEQAHSHLYRLWSEFKIEVISSIGGMTMNEKLYVFGLFDCFDNASEKEQKNICEKLSINTQ